MKADFTKNYYEILEIANQSTIEEIKISYKRLSKIWHPDISKLEGNKEKFKLIVESHEILSNQETKSIYDLKSPWGKEWKEESQFLDFDFSSQGKEFDNFKDVINKTKDDRIHIILLIEEFKNEIEYDRLLLCNNCDGSGKDVNKLSDCLVCKGDRKNSKGEDCFMCEGIGKVESLECEMCNGDGKYQDKVCRLCKGNGKISLSKCDKCDGEGRNKIKNKIILNINDFKDNVFVAKGKGHASKLNIGIIGDVCIKINKTK